MLRNIVDYQQRVRKNGMPREVVSSTGKICHECFSQIDLLYKWSIEQLLS